MKDSSESVVYFYDMLFVREVQNAINAGEGLDTPLGTLLSIVSGIPHEDLMTMAAGGTVNICAGRKEVWWLTE
jgi:hypothetical protein